MLELQRFPRKSANEIEVVNGQIEHDPASGRLWWRHTFPDSFDLLQFPDPLHMGQQGKEHRIEALGMSTEQDSSSLGKLLRQRDCMRVRQADGLFDQDMAAMGKT